jgi:hypothetical protein
MKKQGPPPWGKKMAGWRGLLAVMGRVLRAVGQKGLAGVIVVQTTIYEMPRLTARILPARIYFTGGARKSA